MQALDGKGSILYAVLIWHNILIKCYVKAKFSIQFVKNMFWAQIRLFGRKTIITKFLVKQIPPIKWLAVDNGYWGLCH